MFAKSGEIGDPCGVPEPGSVITPPSKIPTRSQQASSFNICRSMTRRAISAISTS
jgi:hypothetical protein